MHVSCSLYTILDGTKPFQTQKKFMLDILCQLPLPTPCVASAPFTLVVSLPIYNEVRLFVPRNVRSFSVMFMLP